MPFWEDPDKQLRDRAKTAPKRIIAVDMDGTIFDYDHWRGFDHIGKPKWKTIKAMREEKAKGTYIVINSCRVATVDNEIYPHSLDVMRKQLKKYNVPYDQLWLGTGKVYANEYWDDRAVFVGSNGPVYLIEIDIEDPLKSTKKKQSK